MQHYGWVLFALIVLGPLAGAVLLDRLRLGRTASMAGLAVLIGGAVALVLHSTNMAAGTAARMGSDAYSARTVQPPAEALGSTPLAAAASRDLAAKLISDRINFERASQELGALREQVASFGLDRQRSAEALGKARAELEVERAATLKARQELSTVRGHLTGLEASAAKAEPSAAKLQADVETERAEHALTRNEVLGLRQRVAGFEAAKQQAAEATAANVLAILDTERRAHDKTRAALKVAEETAAAHDGARKMLDGELRKADIELKLLRSADGSPHKPMEVAPVKAADPIPAAAAAQSNEMAAPTIAPAPFSNVAATSPVAARGTAPSADVKAPPDAAPALRATMDAGFSRPSFGLQPLASVELVLGQPGSYYRVICREPTAANKRLVFDAGAYNLTGGDINVEPCFKALQINVLDAIPAGRIKVLYTQGHASTQNFVRPQKLDPVDMHMKSLDFLPRSKDGKQFLSKPEKQAVIGTYLNKLLPVMRAAAISDWVSTQTKGARVPVLLEGEFKDPSDEASRSFDFIVYVKW